MLSLATSIYDLYPKYAVALATSESSQIHVNRNDIMKIAYESKASYLIFIDSDMVWLPEHIERLIEFDKDVCGGLCTTRRYYMQRYCVYQNDGRGECKPIENVPTVPIRCFAIGTGFLLLKRSVVVRLWEERAKHGWPFDFLPHGVSVSKSTVQSSYMGEDMSFCARLRKLGLDIWCHPDVRPGHVGDVVLGVPEKDESNLAIVGGDSG